MRHSAAGALPLALTLSLLLSIPVAARAETASPDLLVVLGRDPHLVLPATLLATRSRPALPLLVVDPERLEIPAAFVERLAPKAPLVLASAELEDEALRQLLETLHLPADALVRATDDPREMSLGLLQHLQGPAGSAPTRSGPTFLVEEGDLPGALIATYAAGRTDGWIAFVERGEGAFSWSILAASRSVRVVGRLVRRAGPEVLQTWEDPAALARSLRPDPASPGGRRLVLANPADTRGHFSPPHLSLLAPLVALEQGAELVLVDDDPETVSRLVKERRPETVTLVADILAIGQHEIDDPDDVFQGVTPPRRFALPNLVGLASLAPAEIAVGRLAALDVHDLSLQLARQQASRLGRWPRSGKALMLANVDLKFRLGEAISRATVRELEAAGYTVDARYGAEVEQARKRGVLPGHELVVWEGHPRDLGVDGNLGLRSELLDARLVVLQGCYTLERNDAYVLGALGAESVLGTTMPVYSASGSALAKVFLDAQLKHGATQGEALVHARNYTLAYLRLKQRRGQKQWRKTLRAGLAFDLWGDPTARPLAGLPGGGRGPTVRLRREGWTLSFEVPPGLHPRIETEAYTVSIHPGGQLGSLVSRKKGQAEAPRRVEEVYFGWIELPGLEGPPRLKTALAERDWAMVWSPARRRLYLLVHARAAAAPTFQILH